MLDDRKPKILIVDDEPYNIMILKGFIRKMGYEPVGFESAVSALQNLDPSYDLILSDVMMPMMDGFEFVRRIREDELMQDIPVIMVTTFSEKEYRLRAVESGANDFITKPIDSLELRVRVNSLLKMKSKQDEVRRFQGELNEMVEARTLELRKALADLKNASYEVVHRLTSAAEYRDNETAAHIVRMSKYCALIGKRMGFSDEEADMLLNSSPMHDVGKIGIPDSILLKPGRLSSEEWEVMKMHAFYGAKILDGSDSELLKAAHDIALTHHEKWDGGGYPNGLRGEGIPVYGRIGAIADVFDALTSRRPYKEPFTVELSVDIMKSERKKHFDPEILDVFLDCLPEILRIKEEVGD